MALSMLNPREYGSSREVWFSSVSCGGLRVTCMAGEKSSRWGETGLFQWDRVWRLG